MPTFFQTLGSDTPELEPEKSVEDFRRLTVVFYPETSHVLCRHIQISVHFNLL